MHAVDTSGLGGGRAVQLTEAGRCRDEKSPGCGGRGGKVQGQVQRLSSVLCLRQLQIGNWDFYEGPPRPGGTTIRWRRRELGQAIGDGSQDFIRLIEVAVLRGGEIVQPSNGAGKRGRHRVDETELSAVDGIVETIELGFGLGDPIVDKFVERRALGRVLPPRRAVTLDCHKDRIGLLRD
jgi:hypothetical protein